VPVAQMRVIPDNMESDFMADASTPINAITLLKSDHRKVEGLFEQFEGARKNAQKTKLVEQILTELSVHATIEEEIFYPACKAKDVEEDMILEAYVEHDEAKVLIAELAASSADDEFYDAKVKVLSELIKHHVREEEMDDGIFAQADESEVDLDEIGTQMKARKDALLAEIKADGLPPPTTRSFTGHELEQGEQVESDESEDDEPVEKPRKKK
jgi:hemerythrin superfamily protein